MKSLIASVFALSLLSIVPAGAVGLGIHVGPIGVGAHVGGHHHRHCVRWSHHGHGCREWGW